jgi:hypothetical protein
MRPLDGHDLLNPDEECDLCEQPPVVIDDATGWVACEKHAPLLEHSTENTRHLARL